jgi:hypothetical protein
MTRLADVEDDATGSPEGTGCSSMAATPTSQRRRSPALPRGAEGYGLVFVWFVPRDGAGGVQRRAGLRRTERRNRRAG